MSCRKKIDSKIWLDYVAMETEVRTLKQELSRTRADLKSATKRCRELVKELDTLAASHHSEQNLRDRQLSRILRALLVLESRLRQEQKSIRQQLCEKDAVIRNQQMEIARLRRHTKNYIKSKRQQSLIAATGSSQGKESQNGNVEETSSSRLNDNGLGNDIQRLKKEIISKIGTYDTDEHGKDCGVRKTDSFAGSDVSKESLGSENTDTSILTTTTEGSPSLLSTEGFCEGESTDVSPGSTLNKNTRRTNFENEAEPNRVILGHLEQQEIDENFPKRRMGLIRTEPLEIFDNQVSKISRSDSKDDGMDCNFVSEEEEEAEPIYVNCNENNVRNINDNITRIVDENQFNNNNRPPKLEPQDKSMEETSANWYSDPDEDRICDEILQHNTYRPNSNHNSVLECVNQILLRDMEEEENVRSVSRKFKHRGRIVSFQPARLSDIESVGSEMERRNSEEVSGDKENGGNSEDASSEDEFGMRIGTSEGNRRASGSVDLESGVEDDLEKNSLVRAIPIVIIEPEVNADTANNDIPVSPDLSMKSRSSNRSSSPILRLERIEEKTCLSMSSKGLTLAKNLDYEDIESLPEIVSPPPKTPPALPPKPQFMNNTLILKKIPSPSFLIDETRKKNSPTSQAPGYVKKFLGIGGGSSKPAAAFARSLVFKDKSSRNIDNGNTKETKGKDANKSFVDSNVPRVTNIVRHFEEFKIGVDMEHRAKPKDRKSMHDVEELDIRQNFEEFNLDECDLSDDPDRPDGDGSDRLGNKMINRPDNDLSHTDNSNMNLLSGNSNGIYDHFLEATGLSTKSILTPSRLLSNHKSMLKPKDIKYKNKIKSTAVMEKHGGVPAIGSPQTHVRHWTGPFV